MIVFENCLSLTDSYKFSHWKQYPPGTEGIYSYFESRGSDPKFGFKDCVFFGLQYLLRNLEGHFVTQRRIDLTEKRCRKHFGNNNNFNREGWEYILKKYDGRLPVVIKAVPEGTVVPTHNCLMTVESTDKNVSWLTNWLETYLVQTWYPTTVATQSREMKKILLKYLVKTGTPEDIEFKLHDFGCRGVTCMEQARIGGAAHLVNFKGTDTFPALDFLDEIYGDDCAGFSCPASEHSTITSWMKEHELDALANMLLQYPSGLMACVSDSFDIFNCCGNYWGGTLRDQILQRDGCLVIRPDSGDPLEILPKLLEILSSKFPTTTNSKGYKVLDPHVRLIQGDGIDFQTLEPILQVLVEHGWSTDNIAFGSGGGLLQKLNRDTLKFAFKCADAIVNGTHRDVFKQPITDNGKKSKAGRFKLIESDGLFRTIKETDAGLDRLLKVFENGIITQSYDLKGIRERAAI